MFDVWSTNFLNFFLVFLLLGFVNGLITGVLNLAILGTFDPSPGYFAGSMSSGTPSVGFENRALLGFANLAATATIASLVNGGMTEYAVRRRRGESIAVQPALRSGVQRFFSILGPQLLLTSLVFVVDILPLLWIISQFNLRGPNPGNAIPAIGGAILVIAVGSLFVLYLMIAWTLYAPAIMMEKARATGSLMRSLRMTKGHWWSLFGAVFAVGGLLLIINSALVLPAAALHNPWVTLGAIALTTGLAGSWSVILAAVAYDLLVRQPTFGGPPYFQGPTIGPPVGVAQAPRPPPPASPPSGP
jgi:hypothetical protein